MPLTPTLSPWEREQMPLTQTLSPWEREQIPLSFEEREAERVRISSAAVPALSATAVPIAAGSGQ